jgi:hypothetical protein
VPDFAAVEQAAKVIPADARVVVVYPFYGASPAVWLHRNVLALNNLQTLQTQLPHLEKMCFSYLVLLDLKTRTKSSTTGNLAQILAALPNSSYTSKTRRDSSISNYAAPGSPWRLLCDAEFNSKFASEFVVVYSLSVTNMQSK